MINESNKENSFNANKDSVYIVSDTNDAEISLDSSGKYASSEEYFTTTEYYKTTVDADNFSSLKSSLYLYDKTKDVYNTLETTAEYESTATYYLLSSLKNSFYIIIDASNGYDSLKNALYIMVTSGCYANKSNLFAHYQFTTTGTSTAAKYSSLCLTSGSTLFSRVVFQPINVSENEVYTFDYYIYF